MTTIDLSLPRLSYATRDAIRTNAAGRLDVAIYALANGQCDSLDEARDLIHESVDDGTATIGLSTDELLDLIHEEEDDLGIPPEITTWSEITAAIERTASLCLTSIAARHALEVLDVLEDLLEDRELPVSAIKTGLSYRHFRHNAGRDEGDWNVFEYRNEAEKVYMDLHRYVGDLGEDIELYVEEPIPAGSFNPEIETFDAS
ncbi:MAG: hypothetical protein AAGC60_23535 [Acidobacteriota bacterium]